MNWQIARLSERHARPAAIGFPQEKVSQGELLLAGGKWTQRRLARH